LNDNQTDIYWWNAFKEGDRQAFDNLFRRYYPVLFRYGIQITANREIVDDCIQDLFVELWQSSAATQIKSVKAYFLKALKYKLFRQLKNPQTLQSTDQLEDNYSFEIGHDQFIASREDELSTTKKILIAINQLPNRQREIIYLKIYQGLNYEEISEVMNINYQAARNLFYQAIKSLRQLLGNSEIL
jgi:RNA polymerase sigma factor (sigma-70 family)